MKRFILCFSTVLVFILMAHTGVVRAQKISKTNNFMPYWNLNFNGGASIFFGDIKENKIWPATYANHSEWRLGGGLMLGRQFTPFFGLRGQALYGQLSGIKTTADEYFQSDYIEFNLNGTFNLNSLFAGYNPDRRLNVYLLAGVGLTNYNSTLYKLSTAQVIGRRGYSNGHGLGGRTLEGVALGGMGIAYKISNHLSLKFESVDHVVNTDAMDLHVSGSNHDVFNYTSVGISIRFGEKSQVKEAPHQTQLPKAFSNPAVVPPAKTSEKVKKVQKNASDTLQKEKMPVQPPMKVQKASVDTTQKAQHMQQKPKEPEHHILQVKTILEYRVQISARYGKPVSLTYLSKRYHIPQNKIRTDMHKGYYIYTIGSYDTYGQARQERDVLRSQNGVSGAFVVAFKNGRRLDKLP